VGDAISQAASAALVNFQMIVDDGIRIGREAVRRLWGVDPM